MVKAGLVDKNGEYDLIPDDIIKKYRKRELVPENPLVREYIEALIGVVGLMSEDSVKL